MKTVSLFSSYGLGDLGLRAAGADIVLMAELLETRCGFLKRNFPEADIVCKDLKAGWESVADRATQLLGGEPLHLLVATPPCQGMSTNGAGKLADAVRRGMRPKEDPRNRLIIPALEIAKRLRPRWIVFENVVQMENTVIRHRGPRRILDIVDGMLRNIGYRGGAARVDFGRHGVPQDRRRLITVYGLGETREIGDLLPPETGDATTLKETIGHFEELDARNKLASADDPLHRVKRMKEELYGWVDDIPSPGRTAYDNQCSNPACRFQGNPTVLGKQGPGCPVLCDQCKEILPRPTVTTKPTTTSTTTTATTTRPIKGFRTAYKRMEWDRPAPTVTMNLMTPSSDNKLHPEQNRTLSPAEAVVIQTVDRYPYDWGGASDRELCDALGEAVPPLFFERLLRHLASISD